jgi:hypothetical protein
MKLFLSHDYATPRQAISACNIIHLRHHHDTAADTGEEIYNYH